MIEVIIHSAGPAETGSSITVAPTGDALFEVQKAVTLLVLSVCNNDKRATAKYLGISVKTLYTHLHQYGAMHRDKPR